MTSRECRIRQGKGAEQNTVAEINLARARISGEPPIRSNETFSIGGGEDEAEAYGYGDRQGAPENGCHLGVIASAYGLRRKATGGQAEEAKAQNRNEKSTSQWQWHQYNGPPAIAR